MPFRIAGRSDGEAVPALDKAHEVHGIGKAAGNRPELRLPPGRITP